MHWPGRRRPDGTAVPEYAAPSGEYAWPAPAHPLYSAAFPLCGMVLPHSEEGTMLAALFGDDGRSRVGPGIGAATA
jgi:hypothetical protein